MIVENGVGVFVGCGTGVESVVGLAAGVATKVGVGAILEHAAKIASNPQDSKTNPDFMHTTVRTS